MRGIASHIAVAPQFIVVYWEEVFGIGLHFHPNEFECCPNVGDVIQH